MKILLTGASGFIGLPCLHMLAARGHEVIALARSNPPDVLPKGVVWRQGSLTDFDWVQHTLHEARPEALIHLAWEGIPDFSLGMCLRNFEAGLRLGEAMLSAGCNHLIVSGSCWEYGKVSGRIAEHTHRASPSVFGATKNAQRLVLESLLESAGATLAWGRVFYPYGPRQKATSLAPTLCRAILSGSPLTLRTPHSINDFLYVEDTAEALIFLAEKRAHGVFNIGSGKGTSVGALADHMLQALGKPPLFEANSNAPIEPSGFYADITALNNLGWRPKISLNEGLAKTIAHFQA